MLVEKWYVQEKRDIDEGRAGRALMDCVVRRSMMSAMREWRRRRWCVVHRQCDVDEERAGEALMRWGGTQEECDVVGWRAGEVLMKVSVS